MNRIYQYLIAISVMCLSAHLASMEQGFNRWRHVNTTRIYRNPTDNLDTSFLTGFTSAQFVQLYKNKIEGLVLNQVTYTFYSNNNTKLEIIYHAMDFPNKVEMIVKKTDHSDDEHLEFANREDAQSVPFVENFDSRKFTDYFDAVVVDWLCTERYGGAESNQPQSSSHKKSKNTQPLPLPEPAPQPQAEMESAIPSFIEQHPYFTTIGAFAVSAAVIYGIKAYWESDNSQEAIDEASNPQA